MVTWHRDSLDMSLGELQEMVADRQAWHDAVPGVTESGKTQQLNNKALTIIHHSESASQTTVRCHFVPTPTARITESDDKRGKNTEKTSAWARTSGVQVLRKTFQQFISKLNTEVLHNPSISFLGINPKGMEIHTHAKLAHKRPRQPP